MHSTTRSSRLRGVPSSRSAAVTVGALLVVLAAPGLCDAQQSWMLPWGKSATPAGGARPRSEAAHAATRPATERSRTADASPRPNGNAATARTTPPQQARRPSAEGQSAAATARAASRNPQAAGVRLASAAAAEENGVVLAGGTQSVDCRHCGRRGCGACRPLHGRPEARCNGRCESGGCPAHCPVRPDQFGYYATRWRSWPGQSVKQVSHFDPATTPVTPPAAEVPGMDEEERAFPDEEGDGESMDDESLDEGLEETLDKGADAPTPNAADEAPAVRTDAGAAAAEGAADEARADRGAAATPPEFAEPDADTAPSRGRKSSDDGAQLDSPDRLRERSSLGAPVRGGARGRSADVIPASAPSGGGVPSDDRRAGYPEASSAWRPSGRRGSSDPNAANPLRGVTTQPGNPLR